MTQEQQESAPTRYVATINVPGYLPMDDYPPVFEDASSAWDYLATERRESEDEYGAEGEPYSETVDDLDARATASLDVNRAADPAGWDGTGTVYGDTPGYDGDHDLGLAYSVSVYDGDETED